MPAEDDDFDDDDEPYLDEPYLSQIGLISAVLDYLGKCGLTMPVPRKMNAIIEAANDIMAALESDDRPAKDGVGLSAWLQSDDTGLSSGHMAFNLAAATNHPARHMTSQYAECRHPLDPEDFGRCYRMLRAVPEFRPHVGEMAAAGETWAKLASVWLELERLYEEELPTGKAPKLYERMKQLGC